MSTIRELITGSLRLINVIQANEVATADDMDISLAALDAMIDSWSTDKLSIYLLKPWYFPTVANQKNYTLGSGGDWDVPRPMNIERISVSYNGSLTYDAITGLYTLVPSQNTIDIMMESLTDAQYAAIPVKDQPATYAIKYYDNGNYPLRTVALWPVPTTTQPLTIWLWQPLGTYANLDESLNLPRGYERALRFNLAVELSAEFGKVPQDEVLRIASESYAQLKRINSRSVIMRGDLGLAVPGPSIYNYNMATTIPN